METSIKHVELASGNGINTHCAPDSVLLLKKATNGMTKVVHCASFSQNSAPWCDH